MAITSNSIAPTGSFLTSGDPGQVFTFKGNDFLSPGNIQGNVDQFSKTNMAPPDMFGKNPDSGDILNITQRTAQNIFSSPFGVTNFADPGTAFNSAGVTTAPVFTTATPVASAGVISGQVVKIPSPALVSDMVNFNPLMWVNPSASNVTLGIMDSFNKVMGGNGIFTPPVFNNNILFPFIGPTPPPFSNVTVSTLGGGDNKANTLNEALLFPNTAQSGSNLWNTFLVPRNSTTTTLNSNGTTTTTTTTNNAPISPFGLVTGMFALLWASVNRNA
jgi:hypothetical protein